MIREWKQHYLGGTRTATKFDDIIREYTFAGQLRKETRKHHTTSAATPEVTVTTEYDHDHRGRQTHAWKTVNTGTRTLIARNTYNEVGQLREKDLHSTNSGTSFAHKVTYGYNERGWLRTSSNTLFSQELRYNTGTTKYYNGNIAYQLSTRHNMASTPALVTDTYTYTYDAVNRLTEGTMGSGRGRETLTYDRNGNIRTLQRTGTNSTLVDNLTYAYTGNRLTGVSDAIATVDANYQLPGSTAHTYDANGNVKTRTNASNANNITGTVYNYFNLPQSVTAVVGNATYTYDGRGRKLRSINGVGTQTRDYIDGIEYVGGSTMELIHHEEGRIVRSGSTYEYDYFIRDHLGNNRTGFRQGTNVTTPNFTTDYYPFGMQYMESTFSRPGNPKNQYLYNGKELQDKIKQLDYGARFYDPVIGRFGSIDPHADRYVDLSPYCYVSNNPLIFIDPTGKDLVRIRVPDGQGGVKFAIVDSKIARNAYDYAWAMYDRYGVVVTESYRTDAQQRDVSGSGGMKGKVGKSRHQQGFALDFGVNAAFSKKYGRSATNKEKTEVGEYGEELGWDWRYGLADYPHFELSATDYEYSSSQEAYQVNKDYYDKVGGSKGIPIMTYDKDKKSVTINGKKYEGIQLTREEIVDIVKYLNGLNKREEDDKE